MKDHSDCKRYAVTIDNENFYVILGKDFIQRRIMNIFCNELTKKMGGSNE